MNIETVLSARHETYFLLTMMVYYTRLCVGKKPFIETKTAILRWYVVSLMGLFLNVTRTGRLRSAARLLIDGSRVQVHSLKPI